MTTIPACPSNASKWQMGFNLAFKGLMVCSAEYSLSETKYTYSQIPSWCHCLMTAIFGSIVKVVVNQNTI
jgi:hypothetical protein